MRILGAVQGGFLICENDEGVVLIDHRAAHERVLYEQMMRRFSKQEVRSQKLLLPVTLTLPPREADFLRQHLSTLNDLGVGIHLFGSDTFIVDALPPMVSANDAAAFLHSVANELHGGFDPARRHFRPHHEAVVRAICQQAVRLGQPLDPSAWEALIGDLLACDLPYTCPQGRPTMILFSRAELERKFSRKP
jgi:DNA mismatch repair protein MutL